MTSRRHLQRRWCFQTLGSFINEHGALQPNLLHVKGSDGRFRYEPENKDPSNSASLSELIHLCDIDAANTAAVRVTAQTVPVRNDVRGWNCQDFVMDLLRKLEEKNIVDKRDKGYKKQKDYVQGKVEGLA